MIIDSSYGVSISTLKIIQMGKNLYYYHLYFKVRGRRKAGHFCVEVFDTNFVISFNLN